MDGDAAGHIGLAVVCVLCVIFFQQPIVIIVATILFVYAIGHIIRHRHAYIHHKK